MMNNQGRRLLRQAETEPEVEAGLFSCWNSIFHYVKYGSSSSISSSTSNISQLSGRLAKRSTTSLQKFQKLLKGNKSKPLQNKSADQSQSNLFPLNELHPRNGSNHYNNGEAITNQPTSLRGQNSQVDLYWPPDMFRKLSGSSTVITHTTPENRNDSSFVNSTAFRQTKNRKPGDETLEVSKPRLRNRTSMSSINRKRGPQSAFNDVYSPTTTTSSDEKELTPGCRRLLRMYIMCGADFGDEISV